MLDINLSNLNFCQLLNYGGQPKIQNRYNPPLHCSEYCVACEESGEVFETVGNYFDQMSHGCDTSDFEQLLGPLNGASNQYAVLFLLENPGGAWGNGNVAPYKGYEKQPPVNHYYWSPNINKWPMDADSLPNLYGPYFAYLMKKHSLKNVYITNIIKCNTITEKNLNYNKQKALEICTNLWLRREMEIFSPEYIFCFGKNTHKYFTKHLPEYFNPSRCIVLYHPAARKSRSDFVFENDKRISAFI